MTDTPFREALKEALIFGATDVVTGGSEKAKASREQHIEAIAVDYPAEDHAQGLLHTLKYLLEYGMPCDRCYEDKCEYPDFCDCQCHRDTEKARDKARKAIAAAKGESND